MPARTGTDGRGGRLRAVHATASASTSRATRNFISRPTPALPAAQQGLPRDRGAHGGGSPRSSVHLVTGVPARQAPVRCSSCLLRSFVGAPVPSCGSWSTLKRTNHTQRVAQGFIDRTHSSSSSHVWKMGIEAVRAAQGPKVPVGQLWVVSVLPVSTRGHPDGCAPRPPVVHLLSPASPRWIPRSWAGGVVPRRRPDGFGFTDDPPGVVYTQVRSMFIARMPVFASSPGDRRIGRSVTCRD